MSQKQILEAVLDHDRASLLRLLAEDARTVMDFNRQQYSYEADIYRWYGRGKAPANGQYEPMVEAGGTRLLIHDYDWGVTFHWHWHPGTDKMYPQAVGIVGYPDYGKVNLILADWLISLGATDPENAEAVLWLKNKMEEVEAKYQDEPMYRPKPPKKAREAKSKLAARD